MYFCLFIYVFPPFRTSWVCDFRFCVTWPYSPTLSKYTVHWDSPPTIKMSVRQTLAITDDQLCELMETFSSVSVYCRVMSSDCVRRRDRSLGVPFTHSKPVIGGSHIFCCHSSDVTRKLQKCFDVVFTKNKSFLSHFWYILIL